MQEQLSKDGLNKIAAMVHYVCHNTEKEDLGATKLNKILWFSDWLFYIHNGAPITEETYIKRQHGPVAEHIQEAVALLERSGKLEVKNSSVCGLPKKEYHSKVEPDTSLFTEKQLEHIDNMIGVIGTSHTAESISKLSHQLPWQAAELGEPIPHHAMFMWQLGDVTVADKEWAKDAIGKLNTAKVT